MKRYAKYLLILSLLICSTAVSYAQCCNTSPWGVAIAPTSGNTIISPNNWLSEYSTISAVAAATDYTLIVTGPDSPGWITVYEGSSCGNFVAEGPSPLLFTSLGVGTYYVHWSVDNSCATTTNFHETTIVYGTLVSGCTDPIATNYDPLANFDDGSCVFPPAPPCGTALPAGNTCATATPICDFDGYCGNTSSTYTDNSWTELDNAFCSNIQNNSFISFIADSTDVSLLVWVSNCTFGDGIQFMVFDGGCGSSAVSDYYCNNQMLPGLNSVNVPGLTIGNTYYLMIDGFNADVCDYVVGVTASSGVLIPVTLNTNAVTINSGSSTTLTASGGDGIYTWSLPAGLNSTTGSSVIASPTVTTTYTVSSLAGNPNCPNASTDQVVVTVVNANGCTNSLACNYDPAAIIDDGSCILPNTEPTTECWETATFNNTTCVWDVTGIQNPIPTGLDCWETATFNNTTCVWDVTGIQNPIPTVNCWETATFNTTTCLWEVTGTPPAAPTLACYETLGLFNASTCLWEVTGTQNPQPPIVDCWDNFIFNTGTCVWDNTGSQPIPPILDCYETLALFDTVTCSWNIESNEIFLDFIATSPICRYDESILSINISNSEYNTYTISLQDSILKSFVIDTNGLLIPEGVPITLSPNYSGNVYIVSLEDNDGCPGIYNDNVHIEVKQLPQLAINEEDICEGSPSFTLNNATPNGGFYSINNELTNYLDVENLGVGVYNIEYTYTDPISSCSNQINEIININESPKAGMLFSPQPTDIDNPNIFFRDNSNEIVLYSEWNLGDGTIINDEPNFWHTYADTGTYTIKYYITNIYGCTDSVIKDLTINPIYVTFIPAAFTPNNDGDNDYFYPSIIGGNSYNMKIYNRWGEIIYNEDNGTWDGKINENAVQHGFYSYSILVNDFKNKPFIYTGIVALIK